MKKRNTKKEKKRKQNLIIFIAITLLAVGSILIYKYTTNSKDKDNSITDKKNNEKKEEEEKEEEKNYYKEYKNTKNYKQENLNRYLSFKEKNPDYDYEKIVTYVNIGLDYEFYSYINNADTSKGVLILMNKYFKLSSDYEPDDLEEISSEYFINGNSYVRKLRKEAKDAFERLSVDSKANGTPVYGQSAYRPYSMQENLYNNVVSTSGQAYADTDTARPGHSEHQTGLAIDVSSTKGGNMMNFENTDSFNWMQNNAYKYGFILRYGSTTTNITGFMYESWHYRYVGIEVATDMHNNYPSLTYEEYYYKFIDK